MKIKKYVMLNFFIVFKFNSYKLTSKKFIVQLLRILFPYKSILNVYRVYDVWHNAQRGRIAEVPEIEFPQRGRRRKFFNTPHYLSTIEIQKLK